MDIKWDLYLFFRFASVENPYGPKSRPLHGFQAAEACNHTQRREGLIFYPVAPCPKISLTFSYGDSIMNRNTIESVHRLLRAASACSKGELGAKPSESVTVKSQWGISQDTLKNLSFCRNRKLRSLYAMQTVCTHYGFVMGIFCSWEHEAGCIPTVLR